MDRHLKQTNASIRTFHSRQQFLMLIKSVQATHSNLEDTSRSSAHLNQILFAFGANDCGVHLQARVDFKLSKWQCIG